MNKLLKNISFILVGILAVESIFASEVNLYTSRHYDTDDVLYEDFTSETGIKVNIISGKGKALMQRIRSEGKNSPADIFITVDAANLWKLQKDGYFQSISSDNIQESIPSNLKGPNNEWVALAKRSRVIFYDPKKISKMQIRKLSYEDLADSKWRGKIAIRSSNNIYNQSLVASLIANHGIEETEKWAKGFVANFFRKPQGNDRAQIIAVANGEAEIAIANSYYFGLMLSGKKGSEQKKAAQKVSMHFPSQAGRGTHINISGAGILKNAPNSSNATKLLEFLLTNKAQKHIVDNTYEYPVIPVVRPNKIMSQFGRNFKEDQTSVSEYGKLNPEAVRLMDRVGWK
jgi:iron(III) transport system substrate-binding protein